MVLDEEREISNFVNDILKRASKPSLDSKWKVRSNNTLNSHSARVAFEDAYNHCGKTSQDCHTRIETIGEFVNDILNDVVVQLKDK